MRHWDYATPWWYYVTICTQDNKQILGEIRDGKMHLNGVGKIAEREWLKTPELRKNVELDIHQTMPNHLHGIIIITHRIKKSRIVRVYGNKPVRAYCHTPVQRQFESPSNDLGAIIRGFKSAATKQINQLRGTLGERVWKRNYYEHIIRNEKDLQRIREYIQTNPYNWEEDEYNPENIK